MLLRLREKSPVPFELVAVNLDATAVQSGWVEVDLAALGLEDLTAYTAHDLVSGERYPWWGSRNFVMPDPRRAPAHIFAVTPGHP